MGITPKFFHTLIKINNKCPWQASLIKTWWATKNKGSCVFPSLEYSTIKFSMYRDALGTQEKASTYDVFMVSVHNIWTINYELSNNHEAKSYSFS